MFARYVAFMCLLFVLVVRRLCVSFVCGVCVGVRIHRPRRGSSPKFQGSFVAFRVVHFGSNPRSVFFWQALFFPVWGFAP